MRILAIGERFNQRAWRPSTPELNHSFDLRVKMGVYNHGSRREFLNRLGVHWNDGINLLWPSPIPGDWDATEAKHVVESMRDRVETYDKVLLFGRRVCNAFGVPFEIGVVYNDRYVALPHPSGRSRLWQDREIRKLVRVICERF